MPAKPPIQVVDPGVRELHGMVESFKSNSAHGVLLRLSSSRPYINLPAQLVFEADQGALRPGPDSRVLRIRNSRLNKEFSMPHKQVLFRSAAREKILRGVTELADAVRVTLGPKSKS